MFEIDKKKKKEKKILFNRLYVNSVQIMIFFVFMLKVSKLCFFVFSHWVQNHVG